MGVEAVPAVLKVGDHAPDFTALDSTGIST